MQKFNYEKKLDKLQSIVDKLENFEISLDESLKLFNEAVKLYSDCNEYLQSAKLKVEMMIDENE